MSRADTINNNLVGRRVLNRWQNHSRGVITAVEHGCNGGVRVLFDGRDFDVSMVASDLAFEDLYPGADSTVRRPENGLDPAPHRLADHCTRSNCCA